MVFTILGQRSLGAFRRFDGGSARARHASAGADLDVDFWRLVDRQNAPAHKGQGFVRAEQTVLRLAERATHFASPEPLRAAFDLVTLLFSTMWYEVLKVPGPKDEHALPLLCDDAKADNQAPAQAAPKNHNQNTRHDDD